MKQILLLLFLNEFAFGQSNQEWINTSNPFKDPTPTPVLKNGNYLEIVYELDRKLNPDPASPNNWALITEISAISLSTEISLGTNSYKTDFPGTTLADGKFRFKIYGPDYDPSIVLDRRNWKTLAVSLKYKIKNSSYETQQIEHGNSAYSTPNSPEGSVTLSHVKFNKKDNQFVVELVASHDALKFNQTTIQSSQSGSVISKFKSQSNVQYDQEDKTYKYTVVFDVLPGFDIVQIAKANGQRVYVKTTASSSTNSNFANFAGLGSIEYQIKFEIKDVSGKDVFGLNPMIVTATTSLPSTSLSLIFIDNPLKVGQLPPIVGQPQGDGNSTNKFMFEIPTNEPNFKYGQFNIKFDGNDELGTALLDNTYKISKQIIEESQTTVQQNGIQCKFSISFKKESPGLVKLIFPSTNNSISLTKSPYGIYVVDIALSDQAIRSNLKSVGTDKFLEVQVNAFDRDYSISGIQVKELSKEQATKALEKITGGDEEKKAKINKYLVDNNFVGKIDDMSQTIFNELKKSSSKRDWSKTWQTVAALLLPTAKLLLLLI